MYAKNTDNYLYGGNQYRYPWKKALKRMLKGAPDIMSARQVHRWSPLGKNHVYELIHKGELCAFNYRSSYIIAKTDLIDYLLTHSDDPPVHPTGTGRKKK